ncbi:MAG: hypothetical protein ACI89U_001273 [Gammaproteobacteria bacterium]|jgi:hypothetical protein
MTSLGCIVIHYKEVESLESKGISVSMEKIISN